MLLPAITQDLPASYGAYSTSRVRAWVHVKAWEQAGEAGAVASESGPHANGEHAMRVQPGGVRAPVSLAQQSYSPCCTTTRQGTCMQRWCTRPRHAPKRKVWLAYWQHMGTHPKTYDLLGSRSTVLWILRRAQTPLLSDAGVN